MPSGPATDTTERVARGHHRIHTSTDIEAPADVVWATLTDPEGMSSWSSSLQRIDGDLREGGTITVALKAFGLTRRLDHALIEYVPGQVLAWSDPFLLGMRDHHRLAITSTGETTCRFTNTDEVKGGLAWLLGGPVARSNLRAYVGFNGELRAEAERRAKSVPNH